MSGYLALIVSKIMSCPLCGPAPDHKNSELSPVFASKVPLLLKRKGERGTILGGGAPWRCGRDIVAAGGGAHKLRRTFRTQLGIEFKTFPEMQSVVEHRLGYVKELTRRYRSDPDFMGEVPEVVRLFEQQADFIAR